MSDQLYMTYRNATLAPAAQTFISGAANNGSGLVRITTSTTHGLQTADVISIVSVVGTGGLTAAANGTWTVTAVDSTHFDLQSSTFAGTYTSGGEVLYPDAALKHHPYIIRWGNGSTGAATYGDDIVMLLVATASQSPAVTYYNLNINTHQFISDITSNTSGSGSGPIFARSTALQSKTSFTGSGGTYVGGVANAAGYTYSSPGTAGNIVQTLILAKNTGVDSTSPLIAFLDSYTGLPVTLNGSNLSVSFDTGSNKIYVL